MMIDPYARGLHAEIDRVAKLIANLGSTVFEILSEIVERIDDEELTEIVAAKLMAFAATEEAENL